MERYYNGRVKTMNPEIYIIVEHYRDTMRFGEICDDFPSAQKEVVRLKAIVTKYKPDKYTIGRYEFKEEVEQP